MRRAPRLPSLLVAVIAASGAACSRPRDDAPAEEASAGSRRIDPARFRPEIERIESILCAPSPPTSEDAQVVLRTARDVAGRVGLVTKGRIRAERAAAGWLAFATTVGSEPAGTTGALPRTAQERWWREWQPLRDRTFAPAPWFAACRPRGPDPRR